MAKQPSPSDVPNPSLDGLLRSYYQTQRDEHPVSPGLVDQIMADFPAPQEAPARLWDWSRWLRWSWMPGLATASLVAVMVWKHNPPPSNGTPYNSMTPQPPNRQIVHPTQRPQSTQRVAPTQRILGTIKGPVLQLLHARKTPNGHLHKRITHSESVLSAGDVVQLEYHLPEGMHLMVASLNDKGEVSLFVPFGQKQSKYVAPGHGNLPPDSSLELDDYVGQEMFFLVASKAPFSFAQLKARLLREYERRQHKLSQIKASDFPKSWVVSHILIQKRPAGH